MAKRGVPEWLLACLGTLGFGITAPVLLACFYVSFDIDQGMRGYADDARHMSLGLALQQFISLELTALFLCGPGAVILCLIVYAILRADPAAAQETPDEILLRGRWVGAVIAFANLPGYLSGFVLGWERPLTELRVALLFIVAGVVSGSWIAWQAWRASHPNAPFMPRYSLTTLLGCLLALGAVLTVFAPAK
ncbi:MAG TPA: hypothetical protein VEK08_18010 [Planctomycetota bacterium]|nr:hypothetical protein [Planctomycetota bacterium]